MPTDNGRDVGSLSRRQFAALATGATAGLAGCGGGRNPNDPTPVGGGGGDDSSGGGTTVTADENTVVSRIGWDWAVGDTEFNRFSVAGNVPGAQLRAFYTPLVSYSPIQKEFQYHLADGAPEMEGCSLHVPMKENYTWWHGDPVTADDRVVPHQLVPYFCCGGPDKVPWEAQKVNDYEFKEDKGSVLNEGFASTNMMRPIRGAKIYRPYLERLQDATTEDAEQEVVKEVRDLKISLDEVIEKGLGYGLWKPVSYTSSELVLEKHDGHPYADRTNIERWVWRVSSSNQTFTQAFKQGRYDYGFSPYEENVQDPPENIENIVSYAGSTGRKLGLSWRNKHLARRPVRRAINYLLDREDLGSVVGDVSPATQQTGGMPDRLVEKWVGSDFLDQLIDYGVEGRPEKAAQVMRQAGYEKRGGVWTDEDGDKINGLRFISSSASDNALLGDTISGILSDFGIKTEFSSLEGGSFGDVMSVRTGNAEFDLAIHAAGAQWPVPTGIWNHVRPSTVDGFFHVANLTPPEECTPAAPSVEWTEDTSPVFQIPVDPTPAYPEEVGTETLDGDGQTLNPCKTGPLMRFAVGEERIREIARQWSWWYNFNAFHVQLHTQNRTIWANTDRLEIADNPRLGGVSFGTGPLSNGDISLR
jgi:ABC-type transport system substrate-binding protein